MESKNGVTLQKPLRLDDVDDISSIDDEDTSSSTGDNVTVISHPALSNFAGSAMDTGINKGCQISNEDESLWEFRKSNDVADIRDRNDKKDNNKDKTMIEDDEVSLPDDITMHSLNSDGQSCDADPMAAEVCTTHLLSFVIHPKGNRKESVACSEAESDVGERKMDKQASPPSSKTKVKAKKTKKPTTKDGSHYDSSVTSTKKKHSSKTAIKSKFTPGSFEYIQERLLGCMFSGWVEERKWVESLAGYRDVVEVDEWEEEMNHALLAIIRSVPGVQEGTKWINITPPAINCPCYCVWSLLANPPVPGHYWFTVTGVALHPQFGLKVMLRIIRSIHPHDGEIEAARRKRQKEQAPHGSGRELESLNEQVQEWLQHMKQIHLSVIWSAFSSTFTLSNIRETMRFVIVLCMTLVIGFVALVRESHHYILQFIHTVGVFFHNITPLLQSFLAFVEKIIGGMYLLIAMVYKDVRRPPPPSMTPHPSAIRPPLAVSDSQGFIHPSHVGDGAPRTIKYVPPEHWVYRSQNSRSYDS